MSCFSKTPQIVSIDYIEPLNENEDIQNMIHAIPIDDEEPVIFMVPNLTIIQDERFITIKYKIVSTSFILCCFSIIFIIIAVDTINRNNNSLPTNSINNSSNIKF